MPTSRQQIGTRAVLPFRKKHMKLTPFALTLALLAAVPAWAVPSVPLTPTPPITLPGAAGGFDYMKVDAGQVFASHPGAQTLTVLDIKTITVQEIACGTEVNGVAADAKDGKFFAAGGGGKLLVFDRKTMKQSDALTLSGPADDIVLDPKTDTLYIDHDDGTEVWVVDAKTDKLVKTITIAGAPEFVEFNPADGLVYQNIKATNQVQVIDPKTNTVVKTYPSAPATSPHGLAIDSKNGNLLIAGGGKLVVMDAKTGKVLTSVDTAPRVDQIAFDPGSGRVYCAGRGAISVVQVTKTGATLLANIPSAKGTHTLTVDPKTHAVWASYADDAHSYLQKYECH